MPAYTIEKLLSHRTYPRNGSPGSERLAWWLVRDAAGTIVDAGSSFRELVKEWNATPKKGKGK